DSIEQARREMPADARRRSDEGDATTYSTEGGLAQEAPAEDRGKRRRPRRKRRPRADVIANLRTHEEGAEPVEGAEESEPEA
ncbi:MAG TPA: hypothetical protein VGD49_05230, partial [Longimicrobiales bacterium]